MLRNLKFLVLSELFLLLLLFTINCLYSSEGGIVLAKNAARSLLAKLRDFSRLEPDEAGGSNPTPH